MPVPMPVKEATDVAESSFTNEYTCKARLGDGGTASVYSAVHNSLGDCVAVKVAFRKKQERRWARTKSIFQHEMCMLKRCEHPHIVRSLAFYQGPQDVALVLEHVPGGDFQQVLERHGALAEHTVLVVVAQLVSALAHMHSLDTLHRDIKLENLLLVRFGAAPCIKLCDLGHAALVCEAGDSFTGTCGYAAPEVCQRAFPFWSRSADVWSVGCVTYAMLANSLLTWAGDGPDFSSRTLQAVTLETRLLIRSMLHMNRAERATLTNIASVVAAAGSTDSLKATSIQTTSIRRVALSQHSYSLLDMTSLDKGQLAHVQRAAIEMRWSTLSINSANDSPFTSRAASDVSDPIVSLEPDDAYYDAHHGSDSAHYGAQRDTQYGTQHGTAAAPAAEAAAEAFEGFRGARRRLPGARFECWKRPAWAQYAPSWVPGRSAYARDVHVEAGGVCTVEPSTGRVTNRWPFGQLLAITVDDHNGEISLELDDAGLACCGLPVSPSVRRVPLRLARASEQPVLLTLLRAGMARCTTSTAPAATSRQASAAPPPALPLSPAPTRVRRASKEGEPCMSARSYSLASALGDMRSF